MVNAAQIRQYLEEVSDPEIPVLTIIDLGVVQEIYLADQIWMIELTPTYSGCPAMQQIEVDLLAKLQEKGIANAQVKHVLSAPPLCVYSLSKAASTACQQQVKQRCSDRRRLCTINLKN